LLLLLLWWLLLLLHCQAALIGIPLEICTFDNRGVGRSSSPEDRQQYSTAIMAQDGVALLVRATHCYETASDLFEGETN
jgi:pimeloyl-ACP methyl ester carboxylesterase